MQRRLEGQLAAARDWRADPDNVAWADHPFVGPMLEQGRGDDLVRHAFAVICRYGATVTGGSARAEKPD